MDYNIDLKKIIELYGSIPEGHYIFEEEIPQPKIISYDDIRARRDNMTNVGDLDYDI